MQECIVVTSGKGGVGKSTVSTNLAVHLANVGYKVALLDADVGLRNLDLLLGLERLIEWDVVQAVQGICSLRQVVLPVPSIENLYFVPTSQTSDKMALVPDDMVSVVDALFDDMNFDYVIVDCPAGIERGFENAVAAAQRAIVVVTPDVSSVRDADRVIDLLQKKKMADIQILINRYQPRLVQQGCMLDSQDIWQILDTPIIGVVPESLDVLIASNQGVPFALGQGTLLEETFVRTVQRLQGQEVPFVDFNELTETTVWGKVKQWAKTHMGA
jgi:septum site-determining protein MinD